MTTGNSLPRQTQEDLRRFHTSEELRFLLCQLHEQGDGAWEHDPIAADLMQFVCDKYANLARRHELDPWEAVSAAFQVMRAKSTREARDPWGVITHAVRITCIYEERAQGLLCSVHQARRPHVSSSTTPTGSAPARIRSWTTIRYSPQSMSATTAPRKPATLDTGACRRRQSHRTACPAGLAR